MTTHIPIALPFGALLLTVPQLGGALSAQVTATLAALTPITATASQPGLTVSDSRPIGPLAANDYVAAWLPAGHTAAIGFGIAADAYGAGAGFAHQAWIAPNALAQTAVAAGPAEFLLEFQCPTPTSVSLEVTYHDDTAPGSPQSAMLVDVGNDGLVDFVNGVQSSTLLPLSVGPQPLAIRVALGAALQQPGSILSQLGIRITPRTDVLVTTAAIGCDAGAAGIGATPTFLDHGVRIGAVSFVAAMPFVFVVFGWGTQPLLLPANGTAPCLFVPTIDVVVPLVASQNLDVPLPAALRPVTFWIQGVLPSGQLLTTDCLRVAAL